MAKGASAYKGATENARARRLADAEAMKKKAAEAAAKAEAAAAAAEAAANDESEVEDYDPTACLNAMGELLVHLASTHPIEETRRLAYEVRMELAILNGAPIEELHDEGVFSGWRALTDDYEPIGR